MQIVVEIPEKDVPRVQAIMTIDLHFIDGEVCECTYPYDVLPKSHGRLIDVDDIRVIELEDSLHTIRHEKGDEIDVYIDASTIIEADNAERGSE